MRSDKGWGLSGTRLCWFLAALAVIAYLGWVSARYSRARDPAYWKSVLSSGGPSEEEKVTAAIFVGRMMQRDEDAGRVLARALRDESVMVRRAASYSLLTRSGVGQEAVPGLGQAVGDPDSLVSRRAVETLGKLGADSREAVPQLLEALERPEEEIRAEAIRSLWSIAPDERGVGLALLRTLQDPSRILRQMGASLLGHLGQEPAGARAALREMLDREDGKVAIFAAYALARLSRADRSAPNLSEVSGAAGTGLPIVRQNSVDLLRDSPSLGVPGGDPYFEACVPMPWALSQQVVYIVTLKYQTVGPAAPYAIIWPRPYRPDNLALHDRLPVSVGASTITLVFSPPVDDAPSPILALRNWSSQGTLIVTKAELSQLALDGTR